MKFKTKRKITLYGVLAVVAALVVAVGLFFAYDVPDRVRVYVSPNYVPEISTRGQYEPLRYFVCQNPVTKNRIYLRQGYGFEGEVWSSFFDAEGALLESHFDGGPIFGSPDDPGAQTNVENCSETKDWFFEQKLRR